MNRIFNRHVGIIFLLSISPNVILAKNKTEVLIDSISFKETNDITARKNPLFDNNNEACALIIAHAPLFENLTFEGSNIFKCDKKTDESIWIWVTDNSKRITVKAKDMHPYEIVFADFGFPSLHQKTTYRLDLTKGNEDKQVRYRTVDEIKVRHKTKYVDSFDYEESKTYYFLTYQFEYGYPFGINFGACKKYGAYAFVNYVSSDIQFGWEPDKVDDGSEPSYSLISFGVGPMFRLSPHFYLQAGVGLSTDGGDNEWYFTGGAVCLYRNKRFTAGIGYYYNGASSFYERNIVLDGLTAQIGIAF